MGPSYCEGAPEGRARVSHPCAEVSATSEEHGRLIGNDMVGSV